MGKGGASLIEIDYFYSADVSVTTPKSTALLVLLY